MKKTLLTAGAAVGTLLFAAGRQWRTRSRTSVRIARPVALQSADRAAHRLMTAVIVPVWITAGLFDYFMHRRTHIERTSGARESILHLMMLAEGGPVVLAPLLLEVNAGVLAVIYTFFFAHQATAMWDVDTTTSERVIPSDEQHVHAFLEGVPFGVAMLYTVLHWSQFLALLGLNEERPQFNVHLKEPRMTVRDAALITGAVLSLDILPHVEEYVRCLRAKSQGLVGSETPECVQEVFRDDSPLKARSSAGEFELLGGRV